MKFIRGISIQRPILKITKKHVVLNKDLRRYTVNPNKIGYFKEKHLVPKNQPCAVNRPKFPYFLVLLFQYILSQISSKFETKWTQIKLFNFYI